MSKPIPGEDEREPEEIIEDLESIKDLLDEEAQAPETDVPLLDDPLEEGVTIEEGMTDDTFHALLGDAWQDSVEEIFAEARARIERNSAAWLPEDTDDLADALKVRIDASVQAWLAETLEANIGRLRERIVAELSQAILTHMRGKFGQAPNHQENDPNHG